MSYREKPAKAVVLDAPSLRRALAREATRTFEGSIQRGGKRGGQSFADLLSRVYNVADELVTMLENGDDPTAIQKRADSVKSIAKTLPLLQQAERNAVTQIKHKALEDLTDAELVKLVAASQHSGRAMGDAAENVQIVDAKEASIGIDALVPTASTDSSSPCASFNPCNITKTSHNGFPLKASILSGSTPSRAENKKSTPAELASHHTASSAEKLGPSRSTGANNPPRGPADLETLMDHGGADAGAPEGAGTKGQPGTSDSEQPHPQEPHDARW